jgi:hypothetical protein
MAATVGFLQLPRECTKIYIRFSKPFVASRRLRTTAVKHCIKRVNYILHTVRLDDHTLTLNNYTAKCYSVKKIWFFGSLLTFCLLLKKNVIMFIMFINAMI